MSWLSWKGQPQRVEEGHRLEEEALRGAGVMDTRCSVGLVVDPALQRTFSFDVPLETSGKLTTLILAFPLPIATLSGIIPSSKYSEVALKNPKGQDHEARETSLAWPWFQCRRGFSSSGRLLCRSLW